MSTPGSTIERLVAKPALYPIPEQKQRRQCNPGVVVQEEIALLILTAVYMNENKRARTTCWFFSKEVYFSSFCCGLFGGGGGCALFWPLIAIEVATLVSSVCRKGFCTGRLSITTNDHVSYTLRDTTRTTPCASNVFRLERLQKTYAYYHTPGRSSFAATRNQQCLPRLPRVRGSPYNEKNTCRTSM